MTKIFASQISKLVAIVAMLLTLASCGGAGGGALAVLADVGSGGTGFGVLTGFGSLIMDGMRRDDSAATYMTEAEQGQGVAMAPTGAMLGQKVEYSYDAGGNVQSVLVSPELVGTVTAVGPAGFTVLGMNVTVNSDASAGPVTRFVGYALLAEIQVGDRVEAHGLLKTDSLGRLYLQATLLIHRLPGTGVRLTGYIEKYDASAGTFVLGANLVTLGAATIRPAGTTLANGQLVTVWSDTDPVGNNVSAAVVRVKWPVATSRNVTLSGVVSAYAGAASFQLRNVAVDASTAVITPAGAALADGKYVVVAGSFDVNTKKLTASSVTVFTPAAPTGVELHGTVANFVSIASFTVRGVVVDASSATVTGGTAAQLANGAFVEVRGAIQDNVVRASTVAILALTPLQAPAGSMLDVAGIIATFDAASGSYTMTLASGATMRGTLGSMMFYGNGTSANFVPGQSVMVSGRFNGSVLSTSVADFSEAGAASAPGSIHMEGVAYGVGATSFMLNGLMIQTNGVTVQGGGMMGGHGMMAGSRVSVDVQYSGGQYLATAIRLLNG